MQEDPEVTDFKNAAADTAHDVKKSVKPDDSTASKDGDQKSVLDSVRSLHLRCRSILWLSTA